MGFYILATQKNNFHGLGESQWGPGAFWLILGPKMTIFERFIIKIHVFSFLRFFYHPKHYKRSYKHFLSKFEPSKLLKKGVKKLQNGNFPQKKGFPTEKSCKI